MLIIQFGIHVRYFLNKNSKSANLFNPCHCMFHRSDLSSFLHTCGLNESVFKTTCICLHLISIAYTSNSFAPCLNPPSLNHWQIAGFSHKTSIFNQSNWWQYATRPRLKHRSFQNSPVCCVSVVGALSPPLMRVITLMS